LDNHVAGAETGRERENYPDKFLQMSFHQKPFTRVGTVDIVQAMTQPTTDTKMGAGNGQRRRLLIGTSNKGKLHEMLEVLGVLPFQFVTPTDLGISTDAPEDFDTYVENAIQKAEFYRQSSGGLLTLAEDSGIVVDALEGELGVKTRRWGAGEKASDEEWIEYFLKRMEQVAEPKRTATFLCTAVVLGEDSQPHVFVGETRGIITHELQAPIKVGIPISSCFIPEGFDQVYAALSVEQKNKVSHRGKAMHKVKDFLETLA